MRILRHLSILILTWTTVATGYCCTSAIIDGALTKSGTPLLWKNRDTSATDNKVEYIPATEEGEMAYVALFNAADKRCEQAWIGMNEAGFAVMNTASYNLKNDRVPASQMDREGYLMAHALKHCHSVEDFAYLLQTMPRPLGVEANFGVIDANGDAAYFECNNSQYTRYNLADAIDHILVRTNYSHSGRAGEGYGQIRERNALHLLQPYVDKGGIEAYDLTDGLSCSFYHDLYGADMSECGQRYIIDQDFIPRYTTTASVCIEDGVMWVAMGYPPVAELYAVSLSTDGVPEDLRGLEPDGTSAACNRAKMRKADIFSLKEGNRSRYVDTKVLKEYSAEQRRQNRQIFDKYHTHKNLHK